tara:strand:+ start:340 stop:840 length:501 start_codon:yes stop_codon:yes gene_type:complete
MLDLNKSRVFLMKILLLFLVFILGCSSSDPVNVDKVLIEKMNGRFFKTPTRVYSGPGFKLYKNGKKKEEGKIKNGWRSETWTGYYENGSKKYVGDYEEGKEEGKWTGYFVSGEKKYDGVYSNGFQTGVWNYYNKNGKKRLEETYFTCEEPCEEPHLLGKIIEEKKF